MAEYEKKVREILSQNGCHFVRHGKGSHDVWKSPCAKDPIVVPQKIKSRHMANTILKQSGIDYRF
ncbi:MAG: type II toxin-antitoxin system HicA family toxin [Selenomonadaceae bacterium]|nr:type II toxin-antitoxin system HicA family toxin [Selenomonadaceae bacterium]